MKFQLTQLEQVALARTAHVPIDQRGLRGVAECDLYGVNAIQHHRDRFIGEDHFRCRENSDFFESRPVFPQALGDQNLGNGPDRQA